MRKILLLSLLFILPFCAYAQFGLISNAVSKSKQKKIAKQKTLLIQRYLQLDTIIGDTLSILRVPQDELNKVLDLKVATRIFRLQKDLDTENKKYHENKDVALNNISDDLFLLGIIDNGWDISYYQRERDAYDKYQKVRESEKKKKLVLEKARQDSLKKARIALGELQRKERLLRQDSINKIAAQKADSLALVENPYLYLSRAMEDVAPHRQFTVFYGIDLDFAMPRLSMFLQGDLMKLTPVDFKAVQSGVMEKYEPRISTGKEYLNVRYYIKKEGKYSNITRCEIIGTADLVVRLYIHFWPQKLKLGGYKQGEIAHYEYLGDRVSLYGISPNIYKIIITSGNVKIDYYKNFHIK